MSYRSIKRVLGETHLERKCRLAFGMAMVLVLLVAFGSVYAITGRLVYQTTEQKGRDLVDLSLLKSHFGKFHYLWWQKKGDDEREPRYQEGDVQGMVKVDEMVKSLEREEYYYEFLGFDENPSKRPAEGSWEEETLLRLQKEMEEQLIRLRAESQENGEPVDAGSPPSPEDVVLPPNFVPVFAARQVGDEYQYYQPVYWNTSCNECHASMNNTELAALPAGELSAPPKVKLPFRVVKVVFDVKDTEDASHWTLAVLVTAGICTLCLAMVTLYVIVRYVIVKPLTHLRDVSEEISRGKTELRADLPTGDEFEELAESFNRMLRHMSEAQSDLKTANSDLDAKVDQLAQLNLQLYEANQLKGDFLANMSHELRTPLNSIIGFSEVLQGAATLNDKQKRYAQNIQKSGRLLLEMINDILDFAKLEAGKMEVHVAEFPVDSVVSAQCDMVRPLTDEKNIELEVEVAGDEPPMLQDQGKLQQILTNLLSNAIKFTPEGGRITVSALRDERGRLELSVADTGVGIAEEDLSVIFEKFRQAPSLRGGDNLTRQFSGTGLGLSIVKESCKLLGGEVFLESQLGKGSTFIVALPWRLTDAPSLEMDLEPAAGAMAEV